MEKKDIKVSFSDLSAEELQKKAVELQEREENLQEREAAISQKEISPKSSKPEPGLSFKFDGENYQFTDEAPKKILIDGKGYTQKEIAADENLALALIGGNSGLILKK